MMTPQQFRSLIIDKLDWMGLTPKLLRDFVWTTFQLFFVGWVTVRYVIPDTRRVYDVITARRRIAGDLRAQRASTGDVYRAVKLEPKFMKNHAYRFGRGSVLDLWYGGRFTFGVPLFDQPGYRAALDGYADITVTSPMEVMDISTWAGRVWLAPGHYSIICEPGCKRMLVYVEKGVANISGDSSGTELALHDGEAGAVPRGGRGEKVDSTTFNRYYLDEWGVKP